MIRLTQKKFPDYFQTQPETGMGYWIADVHLKDGRVFGQVIINSGYITRVHGYHEIPFSEADIDPFVVTHAK